MVMCRNTSTPGTFGLLHRNSGADPDRSADSVAFSHGPKKERINITWSEYPVDIVAENITCDERHDDEDFM
ncbi:hypothetical protein EG68_09733 [Paragonimus skrjabini miyazakii]|uniref:Uncharacterized protein n=1 Tax=Paragonimus skrjabini miyazakii TaxID=59628 RepID=A0A8S9YG53_9TREM|nr:hypothetical protein EG68_09733 [Paragonimus skrjabini miyazakii]